MNAKEAVACKIKELLKGKSLYSIHKKTGIPYSTIKSIMKTSSPVIDFTNVILIAYHFDIHVSEFVSGSLFNYENLDLN